MSKRRNKEERIIIAIAEPSLLEGGADKIFPCITRTDAIKRIQERIKEQCWLGDCDSEDVAIEALRGLLGDEK